MKTGFLSVTQDGHVVTVTIRRPERKNAMSQEMWRELARIYAKLSSDGAARVVILEGAGGDFCSGADISEFDQVRADATSARSYERDNSRAFAAIRTCPVPTIASIKGVCFGGGFGLAAACGLRIADPTAVFSVPAARLGLAYPVDAMADIVNAVGPQLAKYLVYSADRLNADQALAAGFLMKVVPVEHDDHVRHLASEIAANAPLTLRATKASVNATLTQRARELEEAEALGDATFESADYAEGRDAFMERRLPIFHGC
ncbi:enoyl-CoA hydratase-related protein [Aquamicrobium zhengzhouense]|uniref:Enoyl-CoA hydratase/isomerase family protein n=1 Tax=Aquamicrobium zhengzhouense TaxID=2781738 RepID=A0ABS0S846_9HYPH|nr:enoyl-CoA hydratase-related protein [Aquamicrobium zhengzhouense]MBI1619469.1 enoyl-CoA hydratase/isomerase family protein [Aquamicrobium zhengzhouense]